MKDKRSPWAKYVAMIRSARSSLRYLEANMDTTHATIVIEKLKDILDSAEAIREGLRPDMDAERERADNVKRLESQLSSMTRKANSFRKRYQETLSELQKFQSATKPEPPPFRQNMDALPRPVPVRRPAPKCPVTSKVVFGSKRAAKANMRTKSADLRSYECPHCNGWHLSGRKN